MKQYIVPTSPKSIERPVHTRRVHQAFITILIGLLCGLFGGVVGGIYVQNILGGLASDESASFLTFRRSEQVFALSSVDQSLATVQFADREWPAIVMSADGWLAFSAEETGDIHSAIVLSHDGISAPINEVVRRDDIGVVFVRIDRLNLKPVTFSQTTLSLGDQLTVYAHLRGEDVYTNTEIQRVDQHAQGSSLLFPRRLWTASLEHGAAGMPAFVDTKECAGMVRRDGAVIPAVWIASAFSRIHADALTTAHIEYETLHALTQAERSERGYPNQGWVVTRGDGAVQVDDIIVSINSVTVTEDMDFASEIIRHAPEAILDIGVIRNGVQMVVPLTVW